MGGDNSKMEGGNEPPSSPFRGPGPSSPAKTGTPGIVQSTVTPSGPGPGGTLKGGSSVDGIATVVSATEETSEENREVALISQLPPFLPLVPSSVNKGTFFSTPDFSVLPTIQPDPFLQIGAKLQYRYKRYGMAISYEQQSIATRVKQMDTRISKSLTNIAHINNDIRQVEETFREIENIRNYFSRTTQMLAAINVRLQRLYQAIPANTTAELELSKNPLDPTPINRRKLQGVHHGSYRSAPFQRYFSGLAFTQGRRPTMEDTHYVNEDIRPLLVRRAKSLGIQGDIFDGIPPIGVFCVYDGHGGDEVAKMCSELLHLLLFEKLLESWDEIRSYARVPDPDVADPSPSPSPSVVDPKKNSPSELERKKESPVQNKLEGGQQAGEQQAGGEQQTSLTANLSENPTQERDEKENGQEKEKEKEKEKEEEEEEGKGERPEQNGSSSISPLTTSSSSPLPTPPPKFLTPTRANTLPPLKEKILKDETFSRPASMPPIRAADEKLKMKLTAELFELKEKESNLKKLFVRVLASVFEEIDKRVLLKAQKLGWDSGSTAAVCVLLWDRLFVSNVGDAETVVGTHRATPADHEGYRVVLMTDKHQPASSEPRHKKIADRERRRIRKAGGVVLNGRVMGALAVSRALGDKYFKKPLNNSHADYVTAHPSVRRETFTGADFLICACDGLWDVFNYQDAVDEVQRRRDEGASPQQIAKALVSKALERGGLDNISVIIVWGVS